MSNLFIHSGACAWDRDDEASWTQSRNSVLFGDKVWIAQIRLNDNVPVPDRNARNCAAVSIRIQEGMGTHRANLYQDVFPSLAYWLTARDSSCEPLRIYLQMEQVALVSLILLVLMGALLCLDLCMREWRSWDQFSALPWSAKAMTVGSRAALVSHFPHQILNAQRADRR